MGSCELRYKLNGTTYSGLSIKDKIKQVNKVYIPTYNSSSTRTSSDYLWLLSCAEIWDNGYKSTGKGYAMGIEGNQYKYYKSTLGSTAYNSSTDITKKPNTSSSSYWWLRSPYYDDSNLFCSVTSGGRCSGNSFGTSNGVAPGFCI